MQNRKSFIRSESGLQLRMTLWVCGTVLTVATVVMMVAASILRGKYEEEVRAQISNDADATQRVLDQRMQRVEYITKTAASCVRSELDNSQNPDFGAMVHDLMQDIECIDAVTLALDKAPDSMPLLYTAFKKKLTDSIAVYDLGTRHESMDGDSSWISSYQHGVSAWYTHYAPKEYPDVRLQCYSVPVYSGDSICRGMLCTMIKEDWLADIVGRYKIRKDVDVSIYNSNGSCIVAPEDYIVNLSPDELITEEHNISRLGWRVVFTADQHVVTDRLSSFIWHLAVVIVVLLLFLVLSVVLSVRYVARPFAMKQQQTAEAKAAMERELQIASGAQRQLVPHVFPPFPERKDLAIHACLHPAREVGGDLYDYFIHDGVLYFCIGDVSGKGVPASLFMAATHYLFRSVASVMPMADALQHINRCLGIDNDLCNFVTFFFGRLDLQTGMLEYCNAGHNAPVLIHGGEARFFAESDSTPLGVWEEAEYMSHSMQLAKGDCVLLYTDGVTEAMNEAGEEYGDGHTLQCIIDCHPKEPQQIIDNIQRSVKTHAGSAPQSDDITMLCVKLV